MLEAITSNTEEQTTDVYNYVRSTIEETKFNEKLLLATRNDLLNTRTR